MRTAARFCWCARARAADLDVFKKVLKRAYLRIPKYVCKWISPISLKICRYVPFGVWIDRAKPLKKFLKGTLKFGYPSEMAEISHYLWV